MLEDPGSEDAAYLAALLLDTVAHFSRRVPGGCGLLVALQTQEEGDNEDVLQLFILRRYFPSQCWLHFEDQNPGQRLLWVSLEPGGLAPREEWSVLFHPDGEMIVTPRTALAGEPSGDSASSTGDQPCASVCDRHSLPQFLSAEKLTTGTHTDPKP